MYYAKIILVAVVAFLLAGCVLKGKPKVAPPVSTAPLTVAPAPAPEPLSIPQTRAELPVEQSLNPAALKTAPQVDPPPPSQPKPTPPASRGPRSAPPPKPVDPPPVVETPRTPIQEILPADVQQQFRDSARRHKAEIRVLLDQARGRRLTPNEKNMVATINQIVKQSDQAEKSQDMRAADVLAERAHILAKELQSGK